MPVECPRYTQMMSRIELAAALMRILPPSSSVTRQFVTSCEALKLKRNNCKTALEREWDQTVHRKAAYEALVDYYYQLASPPISNFDLSCLGVSFHWRDSLSYVSRGIRDKSGMLELCNIIYNIGCVSAGLGRDTVKLSSRPERLPTAKKHFEEAAGAFAEVRSILQRDNEQRWRDRSRVNLELQPQALDALIQCMLAYATRCFYEKAIESANRPKLLAQVAMRVSAAYTSAAGRMDEAVQARQGMDAWLGDWSDYLQLESDYFTAQARIHSADEEEAAGHHAQKRVHLQEASRLMQRVYSASNATKGGGNVLKVHRPNMLRLVTSLKTKLASLEQDVQSIQPCDAATVKLPDPAQIKVEVRLFKDAVKEAVQPGAERPPMPLLFQDVVFDTSGARREHSHDGVISSDSDDPDAARGPTQSTESRAGDAGSPGPGQGQGWSEAPRSTRARQDLLEPQVSVGEPLPPHPRAAQPSGSRVRESCVRTSVTSVRGVSKYAHTKDVVDDEDDDPAARSEHLLRMASEAREEQQLRREREAALRARQERARQEDWQQEAERRQATLALDRRSGAVSPSLQPLSEAVQASLNASRDLSLSLSPEGPEPQVDADAAQSERSGHVREPQAINDNRPSTPMAGDARRRAGPLSFRLGRAGRRSRVSRTSCGWAPGVASAGRRAARARRARRAP